MKLLPINYCEECSKYFLTDLGGDDRCTKSSEKGRVLPKWEIEEIGHIKIPSWCKLKDAGDNDGR